MPSLADFNPDTVAPTTDLLKVLPDFATFAASRVHPMKVRLDTAVNLLAQCEGAIRALSAYAEGKHTQAEQARRALQLLKVAHEVDLSKLSAVMRILSIRDEFE